MKADLSRLNKINVRGLDFYDMSLDDAAMICAAAADDREGGPFVVFTPNAEIAQACLEDEKFAECVKSADLLLQDGAGVILASKILGTPLKTKIAGIDLGERVIEHSAKTGRKVYFLGAAPENGERKAVAALAGEKLAEKYEGFRLCGYHHGYFREEESDQIISEINSLGCDVLFVCLGAPKEEYWIARHKSELSVGLILALGGSLDGYAGVVKRAPEAFIKMNCEWLYRLIKQPSRFKRMLKLPKYVIGAAAERITKKR